MQAFSRIGFTELLAPLLKTKEYKPAWRRNTKKTQIEIAPFIKIYRAVPVSRLMFFFK